MFSDRSPRSACPKCRTKMTLARVTRGPIGFEHQSFECGACDHAEKIIVALNPMTPNAWGGLAGELGKPSTEAHNGNAVTHEVRDGRMIPRAAMSAGFTSIIGRDQRNGK